VNCTSVILEAPKTIGLAELTLPAPGPDEMVVDIRYSGISTGTEKLFYSGQMPPFPGMGYPLVPGYEAAGEVVEAGSGTGFRPGDIVFVPGASCYGDVKGLFGGATNRLVTAADRAVRIDPPWAPRARFWRLPQRRAMRSPGSTRHCRS
jgi:3-hydroxyethyl bacteriochlorophyllide a dehydrogenase